MSQTLDLLNEDVAPAALVAAHGGAGLGDLLDGDNPIANVLSVIDFGAPAMQP